MRSLLRLILRYHNILIFLILEIFAFTSKTNSLIRLIESASNFGLSNFNNIFYYVSYCFAQALFASNLSKRFF